MTVGTDRRPFSRPSVLIVPVNAVHGFDYGMDSDGWPQFSAELKVPVAHLRSARPPAGRASKYRETIMIDACITIHADTALINARNVAS
jgi:hypothetical protein